jgi:hypothetical protein
MWTGRESMDSTAFVLPGLIQLFTKQYLHIQESDNEKL